jgi:hypothetical protein
MENPFESGHIKNYLLLYASVVVIMILFFIASTLFNDIKVHEKKVFNTKVENSQKIKEEHAQTLKQERDAINERRFKLLDPQESY